MSVWDKTGLEVLVPALMDSTHARILSTGGTFQHINSLLPDDRRSRLVQISDYTGQPEMQGGLVKTLDFKIYLGILSEPDNDSHLRDRERTGAELIDMVVVNLYPFGEVVATPDSDIEDARGNIDIGGPCMLRAAAKSFLRVLPVCDPADYGRITDEIRSTGGSVSLATRLEMAKKAFARTAEYDRHIGSYLIDRQLSDIERAMTIEETV